MDGEEALTVEGRGGEVELQVRLTDRGPVLRLDAAAVELVSSGEMKMRSRSLSVETEEGISLRAGRDLEVSAQAASIRGRRGEVAVDANDDLVLNGARVLLNAPTEEEVARQREAVRDLKDYLALPAEVPGAPVRLPPSEPVEEPRGEDES